MTILSIVAFFVLLVIGVGAYRVYLWLASQLVDFTSSSKARQISFVVVVVAITALAYPFLIPTNPVWIQLLVWGCYLGLAAIGAWHIYEFGVGFRNSLPRVES